MRRSWWKAYFFFALAVAIAALSLPLWVEEFREMTWWDWTSIPLSIVQLTGLFGFAWWRRLGVPVVWQVVFLASVFCEGWALVSMATDADLRSGGHEALITLQILGTLLLQGPLLIALFLYGFRCKKLWQLCSAAP